MPGWSAAELGLLVEQRAGSSAPLDRLRAAVDLVDEPRGVGDEVLDRFVAEARSAECSWTEVGALLGGSRQAPGTLAASFPQGSGAVVENAGMAARSNLDSGAFRARPRRRVLSFYGFRGLVPPAQAPWPACPGNPWLWGVWTMNSNWPWSGFMSFSPL